MDYLATGLIRTSFGLKGYLKIHLFGDTAEQLKGVKSVLLVKGVRRKQVEVEDVMIRKKEVLLKLRDVDSPEEGKLYSGWEIHVSREFYPELAEDECYAADLIGCMLVNEKSGDSIGEIVSIVEGAQAPLLEVRTAKGLQLVPFMKQYIGTVSVDKGTVELIADWILE